MTDDDPTPAENPEVPGTPVALPKPISEMPCPFCGSTFAGKVEVKGGYRLRCCVCDAQTGVGMTDEILKGYWERRTP